MQFTNLLTVTSLVTRIYAAKPESVPGMSVLWSDDFSGPAGIFDLSKWRYYNGSITNKEQQTYPPSGDFCKLSGTGSLLITPTKTGTSWKSCRIETHDSWAPPKGGKIRFASRLKLGTPGAKLQGIWPAFWALGKAKRQGIKWPTCGEIDTFENINGNPKGTGTVHCGVTCRGFKGRGGGVEFDYGKAHTWAHVVDNTSPKWQDHSISWYLDNAESPYFTITGSDLGNEDDAIRTMQQAMFITLNVAVGGKYPGQVGADTASGRDAGMEVDYVAVYQDKLHSRV